MAKTNYIVDPRDGTCYRATETEKWSVTVGYLKSYEQARLTDGWYYWCNDGIPRGTYDSSGLEPFKTRDEAWGEATDRFFADGEC